MKTKNRFKLLITAVILLAVASCSLDLDPISEYSERTFGQTSGTDSIKYKTRAEMYSQYQSLYQKLKDQEHWYLDLIMICETRSDNSYGGSTGSQVVPIETNAIDGGNSVVARDWDRYLADVAQANTVVENIDKVPDETLTATERKQWKAEAKIFRAMVWFDMVRFWGNIPVVTKEGTDITAENIEEVYPLYYPKQSDPANAFAQIIKDLTEAIVDAPANNAGNKTILSKSVARAMLAKAYAEKPARDYSKVLQYCNEVIADGFTLNANYSDLYVLNSASTDLKNRSTPESILEVNFFPGGGNWVTWMFGKDLLDPEANFSWAKWVTPSRDLIAAFTNENDNIRKNASIVYYQASWSNYYPSNNYPFMYKMRSSVNSMIKLRLADILLLKAEALANLDGAANLEAAETVVNQIRSRVSLGVLPASAKASKATMLDAILKERRLELAFEGQRWFDLVRYEKVEEVMNTLNSRDSGRLPQRRAFTADSYLFPIPSTAIDLNTNLVQNPGY
ncbi:MAG TPA: RagB/SusD family nutrient uptake outer membrane protein [Paludibacter sp.]|nr:RagB/SusD family nutrient uptake outer membrane protein [Paludibacter sp.]